MNISPKLPFVCAVLATVVALQVSIGSPSDAEAARVIRVINGRRIYIHQSTPRTGSLQKIKIGAGTQQPTFDFAKPGSGWDWGSA